MLTYRKKISPPRVTAGGAAVTLWAERGTLSLGRYGRTIFSQLRAMVLEYPQIAN